MGIPPLLQSDSETVAVIIRITGGNFRLLNRLLTQIQRILETNTVEKMTKAGVEALPVAGATWPRLGSLRYSS
jgi:hypothetical protein